VRILKGFKPCVLEVQILRELQACFAEVRIIKGLETGKKEKKSGERFRSEGSGEANIRKGSTGLARE
jgi:hypothetical protein